MSAKLSFENGAAIAKALVSHDPISTTVMFSFRPRVMYVQGIHPTNRETYCLGVFDAHLDFANAFKEPGEDLDLVVLQNSNALELKEFYKQKDLTLEVFADERQGVKLTFGNNVPVWFSTPPSSCVPCTFFNPEKVMRQLCFNSRAPGSVSIQMPSAEFQHIIKDFAIVGSHLEVSFEPGNPGDPDGCQIVFRSKGENCEAELKCRTDIDSNVHIKAIEVFSAFSCSFVINHIKMTAKGICNSEREVILTLAKDAPLMLNHGTTCENNLFILFAQSY